MPTLLTTKANEKSTYVIVASFTDEDGNAVVPSLIKWSLSNLDGTIINSRTQISYVTDNGTGSGGTLASSVDFILKGTDLAISGTEKEEIRILTVEITYDSTIGTGLINKDEVEFSIYNLIAVT